MNRSTIKASQEKSRKQLKQPPPSGKQEKEFGEGNYKATRQYDQAAEQFAHSGKVAAAAENAKPKNAAEEKSMQRAEAEGRKHSKGEDYTAASVEKSRSKP